MSYSDLYEKPDYEMEKKQLFIQSSFNNFTQGNIKLTYEYEKVIESLIEKMVFLKRFKLEAIKYIRESFSTYISIYSSAAYGESKWYEIIRFPCIISIMDEFKLTALEFSSLQISNIQNFECKIVDIKINEFKENYNKYDQIYNLEAIREFNEKFLQLKMIDEFKIKEQYKLHFYKYPPNKIKVTGKIKVKCNQMIIDYDFDLIPSSFYTRKPYYQLKI